jgi:hypothetical protein
MTLSYPFRSEEKRKDGKKRKKKKKAPKKPKPFDLRSDFLPLRKKLI